MFKKEAECFRRRCFAKEAEEFAKEAEKFAKAAEEFAKEAGCLRGGRVDYGKGRGWGRRRCLRRAIGFSPETQMYLWRRREFSRAVCGEAGLIAVVEEAFAEEAEVITWRKCL